MHTNCPQCGHRFPVVTQQQRETARVCGQSPERLAGAGEATDGRTFDLEPPSATRAAPYLRLVPSERSLDAVRRELLEAHKLHAAASEMQEAAEKAARLAAHHTVEKMARIQQLRNELVRVVEQPEGCAS